METVHSLQEFGQIISENDAVLVYFSTEVCSVCKVLRPKVAEMVSEAFPKLKPVFVELDKLPGLAAQNRVFVAPTIVVFFAGRETIRKSGVFGVDELKFEIKRPYAMIFKAP